MDTNPYAWLGLIFPQKETMIYNALTRQDDEQGNETNLHPMHDSY